MARGNFLQSSFLGGEWSPFVQGASVTEEYANALNLCLNYLPTDEGSLTRRPGFRLAGHAPATAADGIRLIPFISRTDDALICEVTHQKMRFYRRGTLLTEGTVGVTAVSAATPAVVTTAASHGWSNGDTVIFRPVDGVFPLLNRQYLITVVDADEFEIEHTAPLTGDVDGSTFFEPVTLEVARIVEIDLPYDDDEPAELRYAEERDTLYLFHPDYAPRIIDRETLSIATAAFSDGPYFDLNTTAVTLTFSGTTGSVTATASAALFTLVTDAGRLIRVNTGTDEAPNWSWLEITAVASTTSATATIRGPDLASGSATAQWRLGVFSNTTGWPTYGTIHEGRLWLVGDGAPGRVDGSVPFDFFNFEPSTTGADFAVTDNSAVSAVFAGKGRQNAKWLQSVNGGLLVGTDGGEMLVRASSLDDPITAFSIQVRKHTDFGASDAISVRAGRNTLFVQALERAIMEYRETPGAAMDGNDIARVARHLTNSGVSELAYSSVPTPTLWCLRGDKRLIGCTYRDDLQGRQVAWHRHSIDYDADVVLGEDALNRYLRGGGSRTDGHVLAIASAPFSDAEGTRNDLLWMAVQREGVVTVEYMMPPFDASNTTNEAFYVDGGAIYRRGDEDISWELTSEDPITYTFYGLDHLEGREVYGFIRGTQLGPATVAGGEAVFTSAAPLPPPPDEDTPTEYVEVLPGGLTVSGAFVSEFHDTGTTIIGDVHGQAAIITGEDGSRYYVAGGRGGTGGQGSTVHIYDADTGLEAFTLSTTDLQTDADAAGVTTVPISNSLGHSNISTLGSMSATVIPDTPYFVVVCGGAGGTTTSKRVLYYKIDSMGAPEFIGGYAGRPGGLNVQFSPPKAAGAGYVAAGHLVSSPSSGADNSIAYAYSIILAYHGEDRASLVVVPSINDVIANTPLVESTTDHWLTKEEALSAAGFGANIFNLQDSPGGTGRNRGFVLPGSFGSYFCQMFYRTDLEAHAAGTETSPNTFLDVNAVTYPTGLISSVIVTASPVELLISGSPTGKFMPVGAVGPVEVDFHSRFSGFPFDDDTKDYAGNAGLAVDNYYCNPTVYPLDASDPLQPWLLFFPRVYREAGDRDKISVRIMAWDPRARAASQVDFDGGQVYVIGTDVDANTEPGAVSVTWNRTTGDLTLLIRTNMVGESSYIVAEFGSYVPNTQVVTEGAGVEGIVGLPITSRGQLLRPDVDGGSANGYGLGKTRRIDQYGFLFWRTGAISAGVNFDDLVSVPFDSNPDNVVGQPYSGVVHGALQASYDFDNMLCWEQSGPVPGTIIAISGFSYTADR